MITINDGFCNGQTAEDSTEKLTPEHYEDCINHLQLHQLTCPKCGCSACLIAHGYYDRHVKTSDEDLVCFHMFRTKCKECGATHAVLPASMVPYSRIPLDDQVEVIERHNQGETASTIADEIPSVDENAIKHILKKYTRFWVARILSEQIPLAPVPVLIEQCFAHFSLQFMQIRFTPNKLFHRTT